MALAEFQAQGIDLFDELLVDHFQSISFLSVKLETEFEFLAGLCFNMTGMMLLLLNLVPEVSLGFDELLDLAL